MNYEIRTYDSQTHFDNRQWNKIYEGYSSMDEAKFEAVKLISPGGIAKVQSEDREEIEIIHG